MTLRIRCQVLQGVAIFGPIDSISLALKIDLPKEQVQKTLYKLLEEDRIKKSGSVPRTGQGGRPLSIYEVRDDYEPATNVKNKKGRKGSKEMLMRSKKDISVAKIILYRDRKIRLLKTLMEFAIEGERELMIGMLGDYGFDVDKDKW